ncbi:MAG TPA: DUF6765 family protein [Rectinemataceae bacterium]|nr:DUF6765 family protein [Rectinemataceae bacterium]
MNAEFHYYALYFVCLRAGFSHSEANTIAHSSQYVDNAIHAYEVEEGQFRYRSQVTQNYLFWDESTLREIYLPFHFVPGDSERASRERRDGHASRWVVTPDSALVKELLVAALKSAELHRIGIALHTYADSWAHQHFSGRLEEGNAVDPSSPLPPAGHLQALRSPDDAMGRWTDSRLLPALASIDNRSRFLAAAFKIYRYLRTFLRKGFEDEELALDPLARLWRPESGDMKARIASFTVDLDVPPYDRRSWLTAAGIRDETTEEGPFSGYDKFLWFRTELARRSTGGSGTRRVETQGRFAGSELHRWNEAAGEHRALALRLLAAEGLI